MTEPSYIDLFYPERFISLEGNVVSDIEPFSTLVAHVQHDLVRWMIFWDESTSLQLFGVTKDGLAMLQDRLEVDANQRSVVEVEAERSLPRESSDPEWSKCPFLVYSDSRYSYKHQCNYRYGVFWNGHSRFILGMGDEYYDEQDVETSWFSREFGGYVTVDYDDDEGYLDPGSQIDIPDTRSDYADAPNSLVASAESLVYHEAQNLDVAGVSEAFNDLAESGAGGCIGVLHVLVFGMTSLVLKFVVYGLVGLIIANIINYFTGWFDSTEPEDIDALFVISAIGLWGLKALAEHVWKELKERRHG